MTLNTKRSKISYICCISTPRSHISPLFALRLVVLELQATMRKVHIYKLKNDPKITLNNTRSKVPHMHPTTTPVSQISLPFALRSAIFELQTILGQLHWIMPKWPWALKRSKVQGILRQVHRMTPKWPWILKGQRYPLYAFCISTSKSQILLHFTLRPVTFELHVTVREVHWMIPKWHWILKGQIYPIYAVSLLPSPKISLRFALRPAVFALQDNLRQVHQMTPNDLKN